MKYEQIEFKEIEILRNDLCVCSKCNNCKLNCKVYSVSKHTIVYCNKYKRLK